MKEALEEIIKECISHGIPVETDIHENGNLAYRVKGFSKSGEALLYVDEENKEVICETRYKTIDHILSFGDLTSVAKRWYDNYKDRTSFEYVEYFWVSAFKEKYYYGFDYKEEKTYPNDLTVSVNSDDEDLPF